MESQWCRLYSGPLSTPAQKIVAALRSEHRNRAGGNRNYTPQRSDRWYQSQNIWSQAQNSNPSRSWPRPWPSLTGTQGEAVRPSPSAAGPDRGSSSSPTHDTPVPAWMGSTQRDSVFPLVTQDTQQTQEFSLRPESPRNSPTFRFHSPENADSQTGLFFRSPQKEPSVLPLSSPSQNGGCFFSTVTPQKERAPRTSPPSIDTPGFQGGSGLGLPKTATGGVGSGGPVRRLRLPNSGGLGPTDTGGQRHIQAENRTGPAGGRQPQMAVPQSHSALAESGESRGPAELYTQTLRRNLRETCDFEKTAADLLETPVDQNGANDNKDSPATVIDGATTFSRIPTVRSRQRGWNLPVMPSREAPEPGQQESSAPLLTASPAKKWEFGHLLMPQRQTPASAAESDIADVPQQQTSEPDPETRQQSGDVADFHLQRTGPVGEERCDMDVGSDLQRSGFEALTREQRSDTSEVVSDHKISDRGLKEHEDEVLRRSSPPPPPPLPPGSAREPDSETGKPFVSGSPPSERRKGTVLVPARALCSRSNSTETADALTEQENVPDRRTISSTPDNQMETMEAIPDTPLPAIPLRPEAAEGPLAFKPNQNAHVSHNQPPRHGNQDEHKTSDDQRHLRNQKSVSDLCGQRGEDQKREKRNECKGVEWMDRKSISREEKLREQQKKQRISLFNGKTDEERKAGACSGADTARHEGPPAPQRRLSACSRYLPFRAPAARTSLSHSQPHTQVEAASSSTDPSPCPPRPGSSAPLKRPLPPTPSTTAKGCSLKAPRITPSSPTRNTTPTPTLAPTLALTFTPSMTSTPSKTPTSPLRTQTSTLASTFTPRLTSTPNSKATPGQTPSSPSHTSTLIPTFTPRTTFNKTPKATPGQTPSLPPRRPVRWEPPRSSQGPPLSQEERCGGGDSDGGGEGGDGDHSSSEMRAKPVNAGPTMRPTFSCEKRQGLVPNFGSFSETGAKGPPHTGPNGQTRSTLAPNMGPSSQKRLAPNVGPRLQTAASAIAATLRQAADPPNFTSLTPASHISLTNDGAPVRSRTPHPHHHHHPTPLPQSPSHLLPPPPPQKTSTKLRSRTPTRGAKGDPPAAPQGRSRKRARNNVAQDQQLPQPTTDPHGLKAINQKAAGAGRQQKKQQQRPAPIGGGAGDGSGAGPMNGSGGDGGGAKPKCSLALASDPRVWDVGQLSGPEERRSVLAEVASARALVLTLVFQDGSTQLDMEQKNSPSVCGILILLKRALDLSSCPQQTNADEEKLLFLKLEQRPAWVQNQVDQNHEQFIRELLLLVVSGQRQVVCYKAKDLLRTALQHHTHTLNWKHMGGCEVLDPQIAAWLLDPGDSATCFQELLTKHCKLTHPSATHTFTPAQGAQKVTQLISGLNHLYKLMVELRSKLQTKKLCQLHSQLEIRMIPVLAVMESHKIHIDRDALKKTSELLGSKMKQLEQEAHQAAGQQFLVSSSNQLRLVLFEKLRLHERCENKKLPKTLLKQQQSTSEAVLLQLQDLHPLPKIILEHRQVHKIKSTFVDGILSCTNKTFISSTWNQTSAVSGRLSAKNPNFQALPKQPLQITKKQYVHGKESEVVTIHPRTMFIPRQGWTFLSADFCQVELRLLAHLSSDPELLRIFQNPDADVFTMLAAQWKGIKEDAVSSEDREHAKRICYSVVYGAGRERLSGILGVSAEQASRFQDSFLHTYREVQTFIQTTVQHCQHQGYVVSIMGRRRSLPHVNSADWGVRMQAERQAVNFVVQGSAADLCKMAMIRIFSQVASSATLTARLVAQIHDELLFEVEEHQLQEFALLVKRTMESLQHIDSLGVHLTVPLKVVVSSGSSWGSMSELSLPETPACP